MAFQSQNIFINLPVKDLNKSTTFFKELGFEFNLQYTTEDTASMIINDNIFALLMLEERFKAFTKKEMVDPTTSAQAIFCLSADSRDQVNELVNKALSSGGKSSSDPQDHGFMYVWGFEDVDGHLWEIAYMDESAMNQG
ncbi:putative lactoylglutathione lyase [Lysinibacillus parviboronicapiens]|uniref:Lactoylglutathione lyase n=1 Tax=Lysinibacillus parviboronicapiens TaxID=436516 RepID=A0ABV2PMW5_9BACI|nr:VOC family protein [Lysinibacillus parviboronicapiens]